MRLDCQGFRTFRVTRSPPGHTDVKVLSPWRGGSHGSIGCAENPDAEFYPFSTTSVLWGFVHFTHSPATSGTLAVQWGLIVPLAGFLGD